MQEEDNSPCEISDRSAESQRDDDEDLIEKNEPEDNKKLALVLMVMASLSTIGMTTLYKTIAGQGFLLTDYLFLKYLTSISAPILWIKLKRKKISDQFPSTRSWLLLLRNIFGQLTFALLLLAT